MKKDKTKRKSILCKMGIHKPDKYNYLSVTKRRSKRGKVYSRKKYAVCQRCGKKLSIIKKEREKNGI